MNAKHLRLYIVRPALIAVDLHSEAAEQLVMATAAQESQFQYVCQLGGGPALGFFQMEPATYRSIWNDFLAYKHNLTSTVLAAIGSINRPDADRMIWDTRYAAIMCRLRYRWVTDPLPAADDVMAMAAYWKRFYNTAAGKGTEDEFVRHWALTQ